MQVKYVVEIPLQNGSASFTYILRSGAAWFGPIGKETVRIKPGIGLSVQPIAARTLQPVREADGALVWELVNFEPTEDVRVTITNPGGVGDVSVPVRATAGVANREIR